MIDANPSISKITLNVNDLNNNLKDSDCQSGFKNINYLLSAENPH